ncbi:MAG: hypothetical protein ACI867_001985 [Glaciecola sp.]|jgi:hypothetical protein
MTPQMVPNRDGALRFARYAYPPNLLGYCGPTDHEALLDHASVGSSDPGLVELAQGFEGAWPYLQLIAACAGISDPLDDAVVRAYWNGGATLDHVPGRLLATSLDDRFRRRLDGRTEPLALAALTGGRAHHSFHVLAAGPWLGLLRAGRVEPAREVMERCLIRWGTVRAVDGNHATVEVVTLDQDNGRVRLGEPRLEVFRWAHRGRHLTPLAVGATVAVHWDWVCDLLDANSQARLMLETRRSLRAARGAGPICPTQDVGSGSQ